VNSVTGVSTITQKDGTTRNFNSAGYLTSIVDRNGNTTTIAVDPANQNRISSVTDPAGRVLTFSYTNAQFPRLCTSITDAVGSAATYVYDSTGRLSSVTYPDNSEYVFQYNDPNGSTLISQVNDSMGKVVEAHTYDSQRRGLTSQQANGVNLVKVAEYEAGYSHVLDSRGNLSVFTYTTVSQRNHSWLSQGYGCATCASSLPEKIFLTSTGYRTYHSDPGQTKPTVYSYDSAGNVSSVSMLANNPNSAALWGTWNYTYNSFGEVLTATDPLGLAGDPNHTTVNVYDSAGNLKTTTTPSPDGGITAGSTTTFMYYSNGTLQSIQDPLGNTTTLSYYPNGVLGAGQIKTITDANTKVTTYTYDARGNRLTIQDPVNGASKLTVFTYDSMNRLKTITYPGATASISFDYDWRGRRDWVQDQNGFKTYYGYDDADRLTSVTDAQSPTPGVTTYTYDTENNLTDIYDAKQNHTHMDYNANNVWLSKITFPSGLAENYTSYDTYWPNLRSKQDRNGNTINYTYDYQNRLFQKTYPDSTNVEYSYDVAGRLYSVVDANGTYNFIYDNMNRLTEADTIYSFVNLGTLAVKYGYDAASNRKTMTDPQTLSTAYTYDVLNRLYTLSFNGQTPAFQFGYDALSRRNSLTRPNGVNTTYAYDPASSLTSVLHKLGTSTLDGATYTYDPAENRKTRTDKRLNTTLTYGYDNIYQLLTAKQGSTTKESYTYDLVGNRLTSLGVSPYTYNSSNELTSTPTLTYGYDSNGNLKTKSDGTTYSWDYENRLTSVMLPGSGGTASFKYDAFGRRVQKSFTQGTTTTTTNYLYDGRNLLEELDASGNVLARYNQGPSIDEPLSELRGSNTSFYQIDFLGSVTSLSNSAGALANTYAYDSFGNLTASSGSITNPFRFTGSEFDPETGLYNYRFRYYDPSIGRFLSEDPIGFNGGNDFYPYADGNPVSNVDPLGLDTKVCYYPSNIQPWGHVGFGLPQEGEQGTWGFYPDSWNVVNGPGKVKPDDEHKPIQCKTIPAPKDKDQCMLKCRLKRKDNPGKYKGTSRNCTQFVRECLIECGEPHGKGDSPFPKDLIDSLP
jgi:RHS repeat-associated protein